MYVVILNNVLFTSLILTVNCYEIYIVYIQNLIMKNQNIIIAILFMISLWMSYYHYVNMSEAREINDTLAEKNIELRKVAEDVITNRSKIEIIKEQLENSISIQEDRKEKLAEMELVYQTSVWYTRCLEAEWELELKGREYELQCIPYEWDVLWGYWDDSVLENLGRFSSENLNNTLVELGL